VVVDKKAFCSLIVSNEQANVKLFYGISNETSISVADRDRMSFGMWLWGVPDPGLALGLVAKLSDEGHNRHPADRAGDSARSRQILSF